MTRLSVNIDHVATVRQARRATEPDPVAAAVLVELAGAGGITCHIRGDRRHISDRDLERLREIVTTPLNVEMAATPEMLRIARRVRPDLVTLVPERPGEVTTEGGIDAAGRFRSLQAHVRALRRSRIRVSLFIDPDARQVDAAARLGAETVELNTSAYSAARSPSEQARAFDTLVAAAREAATLGLRVAAGHGLTLRNVRPVADIPEIVELNIGHSIVARAVLVGLERAVREMLAAIGAPTG
ncbi:MAG: pyridoxine 5'-phosphate synthase [Acidobacteria bacterium]|nr:MAG: pyridoxine 5'-phosphate synthase [Acidobacteriota bacterium]